MSLLQRLLKNDFVRDIAKLVSGTTVAQAIPFLLLPLFTRLYSPDDFASFEQFLMLTEILVIPATLKYEFAIMQPKRDSDAKQLLYFVLLFCLLISLLYSLIGFATAPFISELLNNPDARVFVPLVGVSVFLLGCHLAFNYWFSRRKRYGLLGTNKVIETSSGEGAKIAYRYGGFENLGLIYGFLTGRLIMVATYAWRYRRGNKHRRFSFKASQVKSLVKEYSDYPRFTTWGSLFGRSTAWMHIFLFSIYFEPIVGFIALARRLAFAPMSIISQSFAQVFYQRISEVDNAREIQRIYDRSLRPLVVFSVAAIVLVHLLPGNTITFFFGDRWGLAQPYIEILIFWFVANFISTCFAFIFLRLKKQKQMLQLDILHLILVVLSIYTGIWLELGAQTTLIIFSATQTAFYIFMILLGRSYVKQLAHQKEDNGS